jgi:hypothetical protein
MDALLLKVNQYVLNPIIGFMFVLALAYFVFGVIEYFLYENSDAERETGKRHILWGLVGLVIMTGFWGIIQILASTLNVPVNHP